jgi:hypothetical protein
MTPENFTYWIQGFFEISDAKKLDETQVQIIKDHLDLVFNKVTPSRSESASKEETTLQGFEWSIEEKTSIPFEFDLMPKVYCSTSSTFDSSFYNKKVC